MGCSKKNEFDNYRDDKYTYDNEKGWHLKESIGKAEKSVLREYPNKKKYLHCYNLSISLAI